MYRHTGGLGDILCIIPSINVLVKTEKVTVVFPEVYRPLFKFYTEVEFLSTEESKYLELRDSYFKFYDLYCPAGDHEIKSGFKPTQSRIISFAKFLNVKIKQEDVFLRWKQNEIKKSKKVVLIQVKSANIAKDIPFEIISFIYSSLSESNVYLIDKSAYKDYKSLYSASLDSLVDLVCNTDLVIAPDSGLFHLAAMCNIPVIGIFGPTDYSTTAEFYPSASGIQMKSDLACSSPCYYSSINNFQSECVDAIGMCMKSIDRQSLLKQIKSKLQNHADSL